MAFMRFCARRLEKLSVLDGVNERIRFFSDLNRLLERLEWVRKLHKLLFNWF